MSYRDPCIDLLNAAADALEQAVAEIERLTEQNQRYRKRLELIAGESSDGLKAIQAKGALTNIGAKLP